MPVGARCHGAAGEAGAFDAEHLAPILPPGTPEGAGFVGPERNDHVNTTGMDVSSWTGAAGGMVSTAQDWDRFLSAPMSGELLPPAQLKQMRTTVAQDRPTG